MKRRFAICIASFLFVAPLSADVTIKQTVQGKALGMGGKTTSTTYIKGNKLRTDTVAGDKVMSTVFDVDDQKIYIFDNKKKEAEVWDMATFAQELSKSVDETSITGSVKANGQTKQIAGRAANGYDVQVSMQAGMAGSRDMNMTVTLSGPTWIVKGAPGSADYANFYRAAVEKGFIFTPPAAAKAQPGQAKAFAEMYRKFAEAGGIPYESTMDIKMGGSGPLGGVLARMGNSTMTMVVDSVETTSLAADLFAPPAGYKLNPKK
jgi:hypothetical protein